MKELKVFHFTEIIFYDLQKTVDFTSIKSEYLRVLNFAIKEEKTINHITTIIFLSLNATIV